MGYNWQNLKLKYQGSSASSSSTASAKNRQVHDYIDLKQIGQGAFANVYKAFDRFNDRQVALKKINLAAITDEQTKKTTIAEIHLFRMLEHKNVVKCYASYNERDRASQIMLVLVLEYVDSGDLENYLQGRSAPFQRLVSEHDIWYLFRQIADAVAYIHKNRIIHRDLKPANVLLTAKGDVKLTDFGLSRVQNRNSGAKTVCGTPYYMAPERIAEQGYSFTSDVWSLGCILYEMAALKSPFFGERDNITSLVEKIRTADYPPIPGDCYTQHLYSLVDACMSPIPSDRPNSREINIIAQSLFETFASGYAEQARAAQLSFNC